MNRSIKFRAWDIESKKMYEPDAIMNGKSWNLLGDYYWDDGMEEKQNDPLMQFTGLLDKNGKEIYEGDIVIIDETNISHFDKYIIAYYNNYFGAYRNLKNYHYSCPFSDDDQITDWFPLSLDREKEAMRVKRFTIIGNIHEHSHLLDKL